MTVRGKYKNQRGWIYMRTKFNKAAFLKRSIIGYLVKCGFIAIIENYGLLLIKWPKLRNWITSALYLIISYFFYTSFVYISKINFETQNMKVGWCHHFMTSSWFAKNCWRLNFQIFMVRLSLEYNIFKFKSYLLTICIRNSF